MTLRNLSVLRPMNVNSIEKKAIIEASIKGLTLLNPQLNPTGKLSKLKLKWNVKSTMVKLKEFWDDIYDFQ